MASEKTGANGSSDPCPAARPDAAAAGSPPPPPPSPLQQQQQQQQPPQQHKHPGRQQQPQRGAKVQSLQKPATVTASAPPAQMPPVAARPKVVLMQKDAAAFRSIVVRMQRVVSDRRAGANTSGRALAAQAMYERKQYKKGLKTAEAILKKYPEHGGATRAVPFGASAACS